MFAQQGVPRDPYEKISDAGQVNAFTGVAPRVSLHIPWDRVDDYAKLARARQRRRASASGRSTPTCSRTTTTCSGSVTNPDPRVRRKATDHLLECVDIMDATGSRELKLWFSDGTNYPGQDDIRARQDRLADGSGRGLRPARRRISGSCWSTSCSSPAFYTMDVPDWGTAYAHCLTLGDQAQVVVDTGHHAPGTNIEFIVAFLLRAGKLGGFDFNSRFYADDDLMVGSADPFQLFRIMHEVVKAGALTPAGDSPPAPSLGVSFMLDQCHNIEPKIPGQIRSVHERAGGDREGPARRPAALAAAQAAGDVLGANAVLMDAYNTDVRALLAEISAPTVGLDADPIAAYARSGYAERIIAERVGGAPAGWGA